MIDELNLSSQGRVSFCESQVLWWIRNYPELYRTSESTAYWKAMQLYILAMMTGNTTEDTIKTVTDAARNFVLMVYAKGYSPVPNLAQTQNPMDGGVLVAQK